MSFWLSFLVSLSSIRCLLFPSSLSFRLTTFFYFCLQHTRNFLVKIYYIQQKRESFLLLQLYLLIHSLIHSSIHSFTF
jgi:hypothetical protein